jgi:hypothetical protein
MIISAPEDIPTMTDAERTLAELQPLPSRIHSFLEEAVPIATKHFDEWGPKKKNGDATLDAHLFPHMIRYHVCRLLKQAEYDAVLAEERDGQLVTPDVRTMAMSGIEIFQHGRRLKIWKSRRGGLPLPGRSESRKQFMEANGLLFSESAGEFFDARNLVLLWDVDGIGGVTLDLVCPMPSDFERDDLSDWKHPQLWAISVPHLATLIRTAPASPAPSVDEEYGRDFRPKGASSEGTTRNQAEDKGTGDKRP